MKSPEISTWEIDGRKNIHETQNVDFVIYPNPSSDQIKISTNEPTAIQLMNINGDIIYCSYEYKTSNQIDVSGLSGGLYLIQLYNGKKVTTEKLIIK